MSSNPLPQKLDEKEWNFEDVPPDELVGCFYYEYARQKARQIKDVQRVLSQMRTALAPETRNFKFLMVIRGALLDALGASQKARTAMPPLWPDYFPDRPWQGIQEGWNAHVLDWLYDPDNKWSHLPSNRLSLHLNGEGGFSIESTVERMKVIDKIFSARPAEFLKTREFGFFGIEWETPDPVLKAAFADWLALRRKLREEAGLPAPPKAVTGRGRYRDKLRWLGALRVKKHYRPGALVDYGDSKLRVAGPYSRQPELYEAARKAEAELGRLFPGNRS